MSHLFVPEEELDKDFRELIFASFFVVNFYNPDESYLYTSKTGRIRAASLKSIQQIITEKKALSRYLDNHKKLAVMLYNPFALEGPFGLDDEGFTTFNVYQPPPWRREAYFHKKPLSTITDVPTEIVDFLQHYCDGDQPSIKWTLDWAANCLRAKNLTFKTAVGDQGSGKNKFSEIMREVVGASNFVKVRGSEILRNKFNSQLRNKQFVLVNEVSMIEKDEIDKAKDFADKMIEIEAKGEDAVEANNYASFFFASNRKDSVKIDPSDRRFSVIQLTDTNLTKAMPSSKIDQLTSIEVTNNLGLYLWNRNITSNLLLPFRSKRYEQVREASLAEWELFLMEKIFAQVEVGAELYLSDLKKKITEEFPYMKNSPGRSKFEDLAKKFPETLKYIDSNNGRRIKVLKSLINDNTKKY